MAYRLPFWLMEAKSQQFQCKRLNYNMFIVKWNLLFLRDNCIPNAVPIFGAAIERHEIVWRNVSTPVKVKSLMQIYCCNYQSICCGWKCQSDCSITPALNLALSVLYALATGLIHWGLTSASRALRCEKPTLCA